MCAGPEGRTSCHPRLGLRSVSPVEAPPDLSGNRRLPVEALVADVVFIVSRSEPTQYMYLKHFWADERREVILDRRRGERRQSLRPPPVERRHVEGRRQRDITQELHSPGWAIVRRPAR